MENVGCEFFAKEGGKPCPYVEKVFAYNKNEGTIEFDGHFYIEENDFPQSFYMNIYKIKKTTFAFKDDDGWEHYTNEYDFQDKMIVELYRREVYEDTSLNGLELKGDPEDNIIFFPTHRQKLWFRVLEVEKN